MKNFWIVTQQDIKNVIDRISLDENILKKESEFSNNKAKYIIQHVMIQTYVEAQIASFKRSLAGIVVLDYEWNAQSEYTIQETDPTSYINSAQYLSNVLEELEPVRIFAGPSAAAYVRLMANFTPSQSEPLGIHLIGTLGNAEVYRAPNSVVPDNVIYIETDKSITKCIIKGLKGSEE